MIIGADYDQQKTRFECQSNNAHQTKLQFDQWNDSQTQHGLLAGHHVVTSIAQTTLAALYLTSMFAFHEPPTSPKCNFKPEIHEHARKQTHTHKTRRPTNRQTVSVLCVLLTRSRERVQIDKLRRKHFGGGGHGRPTMTLTACNRKPVAPSLARPRILIVSEVYVWYMRGPGRAERSLIISHSRHMTHHALNIVPHHRATKSISIRGQRDLFMALMIACYTLHGCLIKDVVYSHFKNGGATERKLLPGRW